MKKSIMVIALILTFTISRAQSAAQDEAAISNVVTTLQNGWNEKSGEKFASVFAPIHDYIVVNGVYLPDLSQQNNARAHQQIFDGIYKTRSLQLKLDRIRFIREDLAQATAFGAGYPAGGNVPKDPEVIMTLLLEKKDAQWKIISFHNHEFNMESVKQASPMPVEAMYAAWYKN